MKIREFWLYTKFQLVTKGILALLILPLYSAIIGMLISSTRRVGISSGDYLEFLFSIQGAGMLAVTLVLLALLTAFDINAFIITSAMIREGRRDLRVRDMIRVSLRSLGNFAKPGGVLLIVYSAVIVPLVGVGMTISATRDFAIPNFISDVIFRTPAYHILYILLMLLLTAVSIRYFFVFHFMLLLRLRVGESLRRASALMKRHLKRFLKDLLLLGLLYVLLALLAIGALIGILYLTSGGGDTSALSSRAEAAFASSAETEAGVPLPPEPGALFRSRVTLIFLLLFLSEAISLFTFLAVPFLTSRTTALFYRYHALEGTPIRAQFDSSLSKRKPIKPAAGDMEETACADDIATKGGSPSKPETPGSKLSGRKRVFVFSTAALAVLILFNLGIAVVTGVYFDEVFRPYRNIEIIAHRGGGNLGAENSIAGLHVAISAGASWSEIDVQRTADGEYIIHHDATFQRLAGDRRASHEMKMEEISSLLIEDQFDRSRTPQKVATLSEFMDASKGNIGLYIELKGATADERMVDDVVAMIREKEMLGETAILSLNYRLIEYTEQKYPEITTGYLYFFSIGKTAQLTGDILIMEEREATAANIEKIHAAGKKAVVWTVNTPESIERFVRSQVDGIITDYVLSVQQGIKERDARSDLEVILEALFE